MNIEVEGDCLLCPFNKDITTCIVDNNVRGNMYKIPADCPLLKGPVTVTMK